MTSLHTIIVEFDVVERSHRTITPDEFHQGELDPTKIYWIHASLTSNGEFKRVAKKINLPEETIKLCLNKTTLPKLIDTDQKLTLKFQCLKEKEFNRNKEEHFDNLIIHLTDQYCFTASKYALPALLEFQNHYNKAIKFAKTPCFILFLIMDNAVNDYAQFLFNYEIFTDQMDIKVRENHENIYNEVVAVKKRVMEIKRCTVAVREILMRLSGRKMSAISDDCRASLLNLFNQSQMIFHEIDSIRDMLNGLLSQIDYSLMHKMNETMRILTAFAAILLPLTLITGIYGMNFHHMPELTWKYGYYGALLLIVAVGFALFFMFKKFKWF